ncbi:ribosome maturation factor RimM [Bacillota bacterium LX-D]|nr:ribosome maturation factor RimM [Bacillota bacterium LX-D]
MLEDLITIGEITTTQGHLGEVRVYPTTDFPEHFTTLEKVACKIAGQVNWLTIAGVRYHKGFVILRFKEISDMNEAEKLKGGLIQISPEELTPLPEGHYYIFQLIGLQVFTIAGEFLGTVKDIQQTGSNDVYYIENSNTGKEVLVPAIKQIVKEVNLSEGKILIEPLPGLID